MGKYQAYPEYKDSGVEWLDKLPIHWSIPSLKMVMDVRDGTHDTPQYIEQSEDSFPLVTSKDVTSGKLLFSDCKYISKIDYLSIISRSKVDVGDILMPMIGTVGSPIVVKERSDFAIKNLALFKTSTNRSINRWFLNYFLQSNECNTQFSLEARGGVQNFVSLGTLRDLGFLQAPLDEQEKIASFLDHETAKIDTLIDKQQQLIQLLKEKRQAVISHAVTKGLNPNAPMRDSGVEWLGEVPEHWEVKQLKFLSTYNDETLSDSVNKNYELEYVDIGSVSATDGIIKTETMLFKDAPSRARRVVRDGDVIISTVRTYLEAISPILNPPNNLVVSTGFAVIRPDKLLNNGYAAYCLRATGFIKEVVSRSVGISYPAINATDLVSIKIPAPPLDEQVQITGYLNKITIKIDVLNKKAQSVIELMQERRTALISAAVTGKIDVRHHASRPAGNDTSEFSA